MPREKKEETKSVKIAASTHARLLVLSSMMNCTISDVIDAAMQQTYPDLIEEVDKLMNRVVKRGTDTNQKNEGN